MRVGVAFSIAIAGERPAAPGLGVGAHFGSSDLRVDRSVGCDRRDNRFRARSAIFQRRPNHPERRHQWRRRRLEQPTTNWTNATGERASNPYDPTAATVTVFGASGSSTPATGGTVVVDPGGIRLTGTVDFNTTGDNSIYTIRGGNLTVAAGGTSFNVDNVAASGASAVITSSIVGSNGISVFGPGTLLLTGANTYAGGTFICSCASLQLGDATHTASIVGAVTNYGTFNIVNANTSGHYLHHQRF